MAVNFIVYYITCRTESLWINKLISMLGVKSSNHHAAGCQSHQESIPWLLRFSLKVLVSFPCGKKKEAPLWLLVFTVKLVDIFFFACRCLLTYSCSPVKQISMSVCRADITNPVVWKRNSLTTVGPSSVIGADAPFHLLKHFIHQWPNPCTPALVHMAGSYADAQTLDIFGCMGHSWHISVWTGCCAPKEYQKCVGLVKLSACQYIIYPLVPHTGPWWSVAHDFHQTLNALIHL